MEQAGTFKKKAISFSSCAYLNLIGSPKADFRSAGGGMITAATKGDVRIRGSGLIRVTSSSLAP